MIQMIQRMLPRDRSLRTVANRPRVEITRRWLKLRMSAAHLPASGSRCRKSAQNRTTSPNYRGLPSSHLAGRQAFCIPLTILLHA